MKFICQLIFALLFTCVNLQSQEIIHYWHFNELPSDTLQTQISADYTVHEGVFTPQPIIVFEGQGEGYMDRVDGTVLNAQFQEEAGYALRVRNPTDERTLLLTLNTTWYKNIQLSFACTRTNNGQTMQLFEYTINGEDFIAFEDNTILLTTEYQLYNYDFADIEGIENNPLFGIRIHFTENASGSSGNNRFDNILMTGERIETEDQPTLIHYWHFNDLASGVISDSILADHSLFMNTPSIYYAGEGDGYLDRVEGTLKNVQLDESAGYALRVRNPSDTRQLVIETPSDGFEEIEISYALMRTNNGQTVNRIEYTIDGTIWLSTDYQFVIETEFEVYRLNFGEFVGVNDNPNFAIRILFTENASGTNGNNRYDNITVFGQPLPADVSGVVITPKSANIGIGDILQLDATVIPANASNPSLFWESLDPDLISVNEQGLITGIAEGQGSVIVRTEDGGFTDTSYIIVQPLLSVFFLVTDGDNPIENAEIHIQSNATFTDVNGIATFALIPDVYTFTVNAAGYLPFQGVLLVESENVNVQITMKAIPTMLAYYWHFNDLTPGSIVEYVFADYPGNLTGFLYYAGEGEGYMDDYENGSPLNLQQDQPTGRALRVRNPSFNRSLVLELPMSLYKNPVLVYDVQKSNNGMLNHIVEYSLDGMVFISLGIQNNTISPTTDYETYIIDLTNISGIENNELFAIRFVFEGNTFQSNGNHRFDNFAVFANESPLRADEKNEVKPFKVYPNPAQDHIRISSAITGGNQRYILYNQLGQVIDTGMVHTIDSEHEQVISLMGLSPGMYLIKLTDGQQFSLVKFVKQ